MGMDKQTQLWQHARTMHAVHRTRIAKQHSFFTDLRIVVTGSLPNRFKRLNWHSTYHVHKKTSLGRLCPNKVFVMAHDCEATASPDSWIDHSVGMHSMDLFFNFRWVNAWAKATSSILYFNECEAEVMSIKTPKHDWATSASSASSHQDTNNKSKPRTWCYFQAFQGRVTRCCLHYSVRENPKKC